MYACGNTYQIPVSPPNVKWILAQSEGEIVFDRACDLGFHSSGLLNGPGALGARGARCRVLLKGKRRKTTGDSLLVLFGPAASLQRDGDMDPPCRDALCIGLLPSNHNNRPDGERA